MIKPDETGSIETAGPLGRYYYWGQPTWAGYIGLFDIMIRASRHEEEEFFNLSLQLQNGSDIMSIFDGDKVVVIVRDVEKGNVLVTRSDSVEKGEPVYLGESMGCVVLERNFVNANDAKSAVRKYIQEGILSDAVLWEELDESWSEGLDLY